MRWNSLPAVCSACLTFVFPSCLMHLGLYMKHETIVSDQFLIPLAVMHTIGSISRIPCHRQIAQRMHQHACLQVVSVRWKWPKLFAEPEHWAWMLSTRVFCRYKRIKWFIQGVRQEDLSWCEVFCYMINNVVGSWLYSQAYVDTLGNILLIYKVWNKRKHSSKAVHLPDRGNKGCGHYWQWWRQMAWSGYNCLRSGDALVC
jgi:hypothetical protein